MKPTDEPPSTTSTSNSASLNAKPGSGPTRRMTSPALIYLSGHYRGMIGFQAIASVHVDTLWLRTASYRSGQQGALTFAVTKICFRLREAALSAAKTREFDLFWVAFIGLLRRVRVTRGMEAGFDGGNVDVVGG